MAILIPILFIALTCVIIWRASDGFEAASEFLGRNLSDGVRGATINAVSSSMPELFTTMFFLFVLSSETDPALMGEGFAGGIGTTAGSAVFNGLIIPASAILVVILLGLAKGVKVSKKVVLRDGIALIIAELLLILFIGGTRLDWWQGFILMMIYVVYIVIMLTLMKKGQSKDGDKEKTEKVHEKKEEEDDGSGHNGRNWIINLILLDLEPLFVRTKIKSSNAWPLLLMSTAVMGAACFLLVEACSELGDALGVPIYFVAVILASAATSMPDTIISIRDAMKGNYDDAVSNAIGSNIFDICFALGLPMFLYTLIKGPIIMNPDIVADVSELRILLLGLTLVAVVIFYLGKSMKIIHVAVLLLLYFIFVGYILGDPEIAGYSEPLSGFLRGIDDYFNEFRFWID